MVGSALHTLDSVEGSGKTFKLVSHGNVASVIQKVRTSPRARMFADLLRSDSSTQSIFFHHWRQLSLLKELSFPLFVSSDTRPSGVDPLVKEAALAKEMSAVKFQGVLTEALPLIEKRVKTFQTRLRAAGIDPDKDSNEQVMGFLLDQMGFLSGGSPIGTMLTKAKPFEDYFADEMGDFGLELLTALKVGVRNDGLDRRNRLIKESALNEVEYEAAVAKLREEEFLRPVLSVLWCRGHPKLPVTSVYVGDQWQVVPQCDTCHERLSHCTYLIPSAASMMFVRHYEGILPYLMAWDLEQNEVPWAAHAYLDGESRDTEKDLVFKPKGKKGVTIVECKSTYTDTPDRTMDVNLRDHLIQLAQHVASYQSKNITVARAVLATNYKTTKERQEMVQRWVMDEERLKCLRVPDFSLIGPNTLECWWK